MDLATYKLSIYKIYSIISVSFGFDLTLICETTTHLKNLIIHREGLN